MSSSGARRQLIQLVVGPAHGLRAVIGNYRRALLRFLREYTFKRELWKNVTLNIIILLSTTNNYVVP